MKMINLFLLMTCLVFHTSGCLGKNAPKNQVKDIKTSKLNSAHKVSIMTFNVENLFDTKHDKGKVDYTFLPKSYKKQKKHIQGCNRINRKKWRDQCLYWDWSDAVLKEKLIRISDSIKQVNNGQGPDIIVFQEIENLSVLENLRKNYLKDLGYIKSILVEGRDKRGIDVAFMTKLPTVGSPDLSFVPFKGVSKKRKADTRGILRQDFKMPNGDIITGYAVHFPAPYHPHKLRIASYDYLNKLIEKLPEGRIAFSAGDFNTPTKENNKYKILNKHAKVHWSIPHEKHCEKCLGTNYYAPKKSWSFLDMIMLSKSLMSSQWQVSHVYIANKSKYQKTSKGRPNSFKLQGENIYGVSDHWPMVVELKLSK